MEKKEDRDMEEEWGEMEKRMKSALKRNRRRGGEEKEDGGMDCKEKKREVRRELRKCRKNSTS